MKKISDHFQFITDSDKPEMINIDLFEEVRKKFWQQLDLTNYSSTINKIIFTFLVFSDYAPSPRKSFINHSKATKSIEIGLNLDWFIITCGNQSEVSTHLVNSILNSLLTLPAFENFWPHALYQDILNLFKL